MTKEEQIRGIIYSAAHKPAGVHYSILHRLGNSLINKPSVEEETN